MMTSFPCMRCPRTVELQGNSKNYDGFGVEKQGNSCAWVLQNQRRVERPGLPLPVAEEGKILGCEPTANLVSGPATLGGAANLSSTRNDRFSAGAGGLFGFVHGCVGLAHEKHGIRVLVASSEGDPDARFQGYLDFVGEDAALRHRGADPLRDVVPVAAVVVAQHDQELVAAKAADHVAGLGRAGEGHGGGGDRGVACLMPIDVVEGLETVEVYEQYGYGLTGLPASTYVIGEKFEHGTAVEQSREHVMGRHFVEDLPLHLALLNPLTEGVDRRL